MDSEHVQKKAHGDAAVYRVWDDERSVEMYVDYISGNIHPNTRLSESKDWLLDAKLARLENRETDGTQWLDNAEEHLRNELF